METILQLFQSIHICPHEIALVVAGVPILGKVFRLVRAWVQA